MTSLAAIAGSIREVAALLPQKENAEAIERLKAIASEIEATAFASILTEITANRVNIKKAAAVLQCSERTITRYAPHCGEKVRGQWQVDLHAAAAFLRGEL